MRRLIPLAGLLVALATPTLASAREHSTPLGRADTLHAAKAAHLSHANTRRLLEGRRLSPRVVQRGLARLNTRGLTAVAAYSSQYPFPRSFGSRSTSGSTLDGAKACYPVSNGGASNSFTEEIRDRMWFVAASRGASSGRLFFQAFGGEGAYDQTCLTRLESLNGFGTGDNQNFGGVAYGHGATVTGRREEYWTGNSPWFGAGNPNNADPLFICTNRWAETTAC